MVMNQDELLAIYGKEVSSDIYITRLMALNVLKELSMMLERLLPALSDSSSIPIVPEGEERELIDCAASLAIHLSSIRDLSLSAHDFLEMVQCVDDEDLTVEQVMEEQSMSGTPIQVSETCYGQMNCTCTSLVRLTNTEGMKRIANFIAAIPD